jgi:hypothetical protein
VPEWRNQVRHPDPKKGEIRNRYDAIPSDYFQLNDWSFGSLDPFGIIALGSDPFGAEWFYPAIALSDIRRIQAGDLDNTSSNADREQVKVKPGPKPALSDSIMEKMLNDLRLELTTPEELKNLKLEALSARYGGANNTANKARKQALARFSQFQN